MNITPLILVPLVFTVEACRHRDTSRTEAAQGATSTRRLEAEGIGDVFRYNYGPRNEGGPKPAVRAAFRRTIGCAQAKVEVAEGLDAALAQGAFAKSGGRAPAYDAWVRVSMDRTALKGVDDFDRSTTAFSLKMLPGKAGTVPPVAPVTGEHDIIMQNHPNFFVDTAREFLMAFFNAKLLKPETLKAVNGAFSADLAQGQTAQEKARTDTILGQMEKDVGNALRITYWSVTPYRYGDAYAKFRLVPLSCDPKGKTPVVDEAIPDKKDKANAGYIRSRFQTDLAAGPACFALQAQLHDGKAEETTETPLDKATVVWDETRHPPRTVAKVTLLPTKAGGDAAALEAACERMRFSPKNAPAAHAPAGSINEARAFIYDRFFSCRREQNAGVKATDEFKARCLPNAP